MPSPAEATPAFLYLPSLPSAGAELALDADDAHYVTRVCRASAGEQLRATDGRGVLARLELLSVRGEVRARVLGTSIAPDGGLCGIACGAPEGQRADWMFEKLAELSVRAIQPLHGARENWERFDSRRERWERLAIAALRQSRQAWRLEILEPVEVRAWLDALPETGERWLLDQEGAPPGGVGGSRSGWGVVGPSAGFDPSERRRLRDACFQPIRLASGRLRTETAAIAWAALWSARRSAASGDEPSSTNP
jgi:16S rRNA (uracil1498-N3)-methyltransferase